MPHTSVSDLNLVRVKPPTPREINLLNRRFWKKESRFLTASAIEASSFREAMGNWAPGPSNPASLSFRDLEVTDSEQQHRQPVSSATEKDPTPEHYVATHYITKELERIGVSKEQLQGMQFRGNNNAWPFAFWPYTWLGKIPDQAIHLVKTYCALKWLLLESPAHSREKEDALRLVTEAMATSTLAIGEKARHAQSKRAKKPRGKITDDGQTLDQVTAGLARQYPTEPAKGIWPHLRAALDEEGLSPEDVVDSKNPQELAYTYDFRGRRKKITFRRFEGVVSKARAEKKKSH